MIRYNFTNFASIRVNYADLTLFVPRSKPLLLAAIKPT
jgi:hypothetical protein